MTLMFSYPLVNSISKIDKNPQKYLKPENLEFLKKGVDGLLNSKSYLLASQMFKLGLGLAIAAPKAILTAIGLPYIFDKLFNKNNSELFLKSNEQSNTTINFKSSRTEPLTSCIAKILNSKNFLKFSDKYKDSNFPMHIIALKDTITTGTFIVQAAQSKKIDENRKMPLIYNSFIATGLSIASTYFLDEITEKPMRKFLIALKKANKNDVNLDKYVKGAKIAKPILIMGSVYYILIPLISTFFAERIGNGSKLSASTR